MRNKIVHVGWLCLLMGYILLGTPFTPFHADESTIIWMSKDYDYLLRQGDFERVRYDEQPDYPEEQHLRLLNGTLSRYLIGFAWTMNGYTVDDLPQQWHWSFDWNWNVSNGHYPSQGILQVSRLASALPLCLSVIALFGIGWHVGGWRMAYLASLIYTLNPAVLLNGRRAMFEGGLLLFSTLLVLTALWYLRDRRWWQVIVMGIITGLAITSKHTAVFVVIAVFLPLGLMCIFPVFKPKYLIQLIIAGVIGLGVFYIFNPVWWGNPLERIGHVLEARADLLATQTAVFGGYSDFTDKTFGFWRQSFAVVPQYFEVDGWQNYIGTEINDYENSLFSGLYFGVIGGVLLSMFFVGGIIHTVKNRNQAGYLLLTWAGVVLLGTWLITPIEWQRYYLLAYPIISIYAASGGVMLWDTFGKSRFLTQNQ